MSGGEETRKVGTPADPAPKSERNGKQERISDEEHVVLLGLKTEIEELKRNEVALDRRLTITKAERYRKEDEMVVKLTAITEKYKLKKGRELLIQTGEILEA